MKAKSLDDVLVYQKAVQAADEVSALLERPVFGKDFDLKDQLSRSSARVPPLIAEGFGQTTDRHLAVYLGRARGSSLETQTHLRRALSKRCISQSELVKLSDSYAEIGKMLTSWIRYLRSSNWKDRG